MIKTRAAILLGANPTRIMNDSLIRYFREIKFMRNIRVDLNVTEPISAFDIDSRGVK